MPRKPSNDVVTHRIELGVKERQILEKQILPTLLGSKVGMTTAQIIGAVGSVSASTLLAYIALWKAWKDYPTLKDEMYEHLGWLKAKIEDISEDEIIIPSSIEGEPPTEEQRKTAKPMFYYPLKKLWDWLF